tara:strand:- start:290 stop:643 length:354 start_codon:yes stop_codon:yes gene_type:complete
MALQYKVTIRGPKNAVANEPNDFRVWFSDYTGSLGSPAVKNLYQSGKIVAYPALEVTVNGTGADDTRPVCTALYEFDSAISREQFIMNSHEYGAEMIQWRDYLIGADFFFDGESIDT